MRLCKTDAIYFRKSVLFTSTKVQKEKLSKYKLLFQKQKLLAMEPSIA